MLGKLRMLPRPGVGRAWGGESTHRLAGRNNVLTLTHSDKPTNRKQPQTNLFGTFQSLGHGALPAAVLETGK